MANSENKKSAFEILNAINVNDHTETKNAGGTNLTYLSWAWAWAEVKKAYPDATYEIEKFNGIPYAYDPLTGFMVYTRVTIEGITHEMWLPVMDNQNKAMKAEPYQIQTKYKTITVPAATMFDVNKTIMRCLVKNLAMFGLGLYIYAGEDLPEETKEESQVVTAKKPATKKAPAADQITCQRCGVVIGTHGKATAQQIATATKKQFGKVMCWECGHITKQEQEAQAQMAIDPETQLPFPIEE
jgi:hypothetical protein